MTFTRYHSPIMLNCTIIQPAGLTVQNIGFTFAFSLIPKIHISMITCKSLKFLDLIKRISSKLKLFNSSESLYLRACPTNIWIWLGYKLNITCSPHDYSPVFLKLNLIFLADRRHALNIAFLQKLVI